MSKKALASGSKTKAHLPDPDAQAKQQQLKHYEEALKQFQQQKWSRAKELFERVLEGPAKDLTDRAQMHLRVCSQRIAPAPASAPRSAEDHYTQGVGLMNMGRWDEAREHLDRAGVIIRERAGTARFVDPHTIETEHGLRLQAHKFILCAGGISRRLSVPGFELTATHSDAWSLTAVPPSMLVVGGDPRIGTLIGTDIRSYLDRRQASADLHGLGLVGTQFPQLGCSLAAPRQDADYGVDAEHRQRLVHRADLGP